MSFFSNFGRSIRTLGSTLGKGIHGLARKGNAFLDNALKIGEKAQGILAGAKEIPVLAPVRGLIEKAESGLSAVRRGAEAVRKIGGSVEMGTDALLRPEMYGGGRVAGVRHLINAGQDTKSALLGLRRFLAR